ncbi:MAG: NUDIX hydrolase [Actinomycetota bacterium]|nr:NUDIX hydrolase [Actinomycetota bacterium]
MLRRLHRLALRIFEQLPRSLRRRIVRVLAPTFSVGAICCIERDDGAILLVRQSYRRRWGLPGGLLQKGESAHAAVVREVAEEVGLDLVLSGEPAVVVDGQARRVDVVFRGRPASRADADAVAPRSPEIDEVRWFHADELPELQAEAAGALVTLARSASHPQAVPLPSELRVLRT